MKNVDLSAINIDKSLEIKDPAALKSHIIHLKAVLNVY